MEGKKKGRRWFIIIALAFFFVVMVILMISMGGDVLKEIQITWGLKYFLLVRRRVPQAWYPFVLLPNMSGNFVNITTPSGRMAGEPVRAKMVATCYRARFSRVFAAAMVDKASLTIAMLSLLIPLSLYATLSFDMPRLLQYLTGAFVLFWIIIGFFSYLIFRNLGEKQSKKVGSFIHRISKFLLGSRSKDRRYYIERFKSGIVEFRSSFRFLAKNPFFMALDLILGLLIYSFRFAAAYMLFIAVGHSVPFLTVAMVVMIAFAIGLLSQMPGMIGVAESTMTGLYVGVGIAPATALTVSIMTTTVMWMI